MMSLGETWPCGHKSDAPDPKCHCCATRLDEDDGGEYEHQHDPFTDEEGRFWDEDEELRT